MMKILAKKTVPVKNGKGVQINKTGAAFGDVVFGQEGQTNLVVFQTGAALTFFREYALRRPRLIDDALGIYAHGSIGRLGKVKWNTINAPKHILQPRSEGCSWNPKGKFTFDGDEIIAKGLEINIEMCHRDMLDDCTRQFFGTGVDIDTILSTEEGQKLFDLFLNAIYEAKGNSLYDLVTFGDHPFISQADIAGVYGMPADEFADYKDQMAILGGHLTMIDYEKAIGREEYNVVIDSTEINGGEFIGDSFDLLRRVKQKAPVTMQTIINTSKMKGKPGLFLVSPSIFYKYEADLEAANQLNKAQVIMKGIYEYSDTVDGVLKFGGDYVVNRSDWKEFDNIVKKDTHRVVYVAPQSLGIAYDIPALDQNGTDKSGLIVEHSKAVKDKQKTYIYGQLEMGTGLVNKKNIVNASISVPQ